MARHNFGGSPADLLVDAPSAHGNAVVALPNLTGGTVWDSPSGGTRLTDLLDGSGAATSTITTDANGYVNRFQAPDGVSLVWITFGAGRFSLLTTDQAAFTGPPGSAGPAGAAFLDIPGEVFFSESFPDADGSTIAVGSVGRAAQTGQLLVADGSKSTDRTAMVTAGEQYWHTLPVNGTPIGILGPGLSRVPSAVKTRFRMINSGSTITHNAVMGIAGGPGATSLPAFATGSVQMTVYPDHMSVFCVPNPIVDPYPSLGTTTFATQIPDGEVLEMLMVHDPVSHSIEATLMGATNGLVRISVADCRYSGVDYWSPSNDGRIRFAWQLRRNASTDGEVRFRLAQAAA